MSGAEGGMFPPGRYTSKCDANNRPRPLQIHTPTDPDHPGTITGTITAARAYGYSESEPTATRYHFANDVVGYPNLILFV